MKLKNVLFIAIAILTIGLFVACNDEVVASKDNNLAYTQVLESNGAFEYNGTKYETLNDALKSIADSKSSVDGVIKVLRNVSSDAATVPSGVNVGLNLNGKTLTFLSANGITVDGGLYVVGDGEFAFSEGVTGGTAIAVSGTGYFYVEEAKFNVPGQNAVKATGGTVNLRGNTQITGNIEASGTSTVNLSNYSKFTEKGTVTIGTGATVSVSTTNKPTMVLNLEGGTLEVSSKVALDEDSSLDSGVIVLPSEATDNYIEKPESLDISQITMSTGLFSISRTTGMTYYKSLQDAIVEYESSDLVITQIFADTTDASIGVEKCVSGVTTVKINTKNNGDTSDIGALTVSAGYTLEVTGNGTVESVTLESTTTPTYGTLRAVGDSANKPTISAVSGGGKAYFTYASVGTVDGVSSMKSSHSTFTGAIGSTTKIGTLDDGYTEDQVEVDGNSTFQGAIKATGLISLSGSILDPSSDDDHFVYTEAADDDIASITLSGVTFDDGTVNVYAGVFSYNGGSISISNSIGIARSITATGTTPNSIVINNSSLSSGSSLTVMNEVASRGFTDNYSGQVTITGSNPGSVIINKIDAASIAIHYATVKDVTGTSGDSGARAKSGNFVSDNSVFESVVEANGNLTDGAKANLTTPEKKGSTFKNAISVTGTSSFYKSTFDPSENATGFYASTVEIKEAVFSTNSEGGSTGKLYNIEAKKTETESSADKSEDNLKITASTGFVGTLKTSGNTSNTVDTVTYHYYSNIVVGNSSFTAESPAKTLSIGDVSSTYTGGTAAYGNVTIKGGTTANTVTVSSISLADAVKTSYAVVTGNIGSTGTPVATVSDGWTDSPAVAGYSTFNGNIYASGAGTFNNSTFAPTSSGETAGNKDLKALSLSISGSTFTKTGTTSAYVYSLEATKEYAAASNAISISSSNGSIGTITASKAGNISIVSTTGETGNITLSATTTSTTAPSVGSIVIDNSAFSEASTLAKTLSTGSLSARYVYDTGSDPDKYVYGDITVRGGSASNTVTVASIPYANDVKTSYAVVSGDIGSDTTKVKTVSDGWDSVDGKSEFNGNIYASGAGTFYDSTFSASGSDKTLTARNVTINRGVFDKDSSDKRYNVNDSSNTDGGVTINDSTGYLGAVKSDYVITINNKNATDDLYINYRSDDSNKHAIYANGHSIHITGPNASGKKIDITGQISGGVNVNMYAGGTDYDDSSLIVHNIEDRAEIVGPTINIFGGTYYGTGNYAILSGDVNVHKGTFYVGKTNDSALRSVAGNIVNNTDYTVVIKISGDITLSAPLVVGLKNASSFNISPEKNVYFESETGYSYSIKALYNDSDSSTTSTHYTTVPVVLAGGRIVFNKIRVSLDTCTVETALNYSYLGNYAFWWKNNGVTVVKATGEETFANPHEFTNNSEIHWNAQ